MDSPIQCNADINRTTIFLSSMSCFPFVGMVKGKAPVFFMVLIIVLITILVGTKVPLRCLPQELHANALGSFTIAYNRVRSYSLGSFFLRIVLVQHC